MPQYSVCVCVCVEKKQVQYLYGRVLCEVFVCEREDAHECHQSRVLEQAGFPRQRHFVLASRVNKV